MMIKPKAVNGPSVPIQSIEGIGKKRAVKLQEAGAESVTDLLAFPPQRLHLALGESVSTKQIEKWRNAALFLQVAQMNSQWAEVLAKAKISDLVDFYQRPIRELKKLFKAEKTKGTIPNVPDTDTLAALQVDAAVLHHTGSISGVVINPEGEPVAGATVRAVRLKTTTDQRGAFILARIPRGIPGTVLRIKAEGYRVAVIEDPVITRNSRVISKRRYTLETISEEAEKREVAVLSERKGDKLPPLSGKRMRTRTLEKPPADDIILVRRIDKKKKRAETISRFLTYQEGDIFIDRYVIKPDELPEGVKEGDYITLDDKDYKKLDMNRHKVSAAKRMRRAQKVLGQPPTSDPQAITEYYKKLLRHAIERGPMGAALRKKRT